MADLGCIYQAYFLYCCYYVNVYMVKEYISPEKHCINNTSAECVGITEIEIYEIVKTKDVHYGKALP